MYNHILYTAPRKIVVAPRIAATGLTSNAPPKHNNSEIQFKDPGTPILAQVAKKNHNLKEGIEEPNPLK